MGTLFEINGSTGIVDFKQKGTANLVLENGTSTPLTGVEGQLFWRSDIDELLVYNGTSFVAINGATAGGWTDGAGNVTLADTSKQVRIGDGLVGTPSLSFASDTVTGIYHVGSNDIGFSTNGILRLDISTSGITSTIPFLALDGSLSNPAYSFATEPGLGWYRSGTNGINLASNGTARIVINGTNGRIQLGKVTEPRILIGADLGTILMDSAQVQITQTTNQITLGNTSGNYTIITSPAPSATRTYTIPDAGATASFVMTAGAQTIAGQKTFSSAILETNGSGSAPAYSFSAETSSGFYFITGGQFAAATQNSISTIFTVNGLQANTGSVGAPGYAFAADTDTGMYFISADNLGFATNGTQRLSLTTTALNYSVNCVPVTDITNDNGDSTHRWLNIWGQTIHSGDIELENNWKITEGDKVGYPEEGIMFLSPTGKKYKIVMTEVE